MSDLHCGFYLMDKILECEPQRFSSIFPIVLIENSPGYQINTKSGE